MFKTPLQRRLFWKPYFKLWWYFNFSLCPSPLFQFLNLFQSSTSANLHPLFRFSFHWSLITRHVSQCTEIIISSLSFSFSVATQTLVLLSSDSPGQRWSLHFLTSSPLPSHCCPVTAAPWHTRARLCHPPSQDLEQPLHGPQGFHWPLAKTEAFSVRNRDYYIHNNYNQPSPNTRSTQMIQQYKWLYLVCDILAVIFFYIYVFFYPCF